MFRCDIGLHILGLVAILSKLVIVIPSTFYGGCPGKVHPGRMEDRARRILRIRNALFAITYLMLSDLAGCAWAND